MRIAIIMLLLMPAIALGDNVDQCSLAEAPLRFAVLGDRTHQYVPAVYGQIIDEINQLQPDLVVCIGDMIEGSASDTGVMNDQWAEYRSIINHLEAPVYFTPGNHDIPTDDAEVLYRRYIGDPQLSFFHRGVHFLILDNSRRKRESQILADSTWMNSEFSRHEEALYNLVFYHRPLWFKSTAQGVQGELHSYFLDQGVDAVFSGHDHCYYSGVYDGICYTTIGSSGAEVEPSPSDLGYHFLWVTIDEKGIKITPVRLGATATWDETTADEILLTERILSKGLEFEKPVVLFQTAAASEVTIMIHNPNEQLSIDDSLRWEVSDGWVVSPAAHPLQLPPHETTQLQFEVVCHGVPYPTPSVSLSFPIRPGRNYTLERSLYVNQTQVCKRMTKPPNLNGDLTEWSNLSPATGVCLPDQVTRLDSTEFYFAWDENYLYLAARCLEREMSSLVSTGSKRDNIPYTDDRIGFYLYSDLSDSCLFFININAGGTISDTKLTFTPEGNVKYDVSWNTDCQAVTERSSEGWTLEASIPLLQLNRQKSPPKQWGLKLERYQSSYGALGYWQLPTYLIRESFGFLVFEQ